MTVAKQADVSGSAEHFFDVVFEGKPMIVPRAGGNLVVLMQSDYEEMAKAKRNAEYIAKIERGFAQIADGKGITKTMEELEEMAK